MLNNADREIFAKLQAKCDALIAAAPKVYALAAQRAIDAGGSAADVRKAIDVAHAQMALIVGELELAVTGPVDLVPK